MLKVTEPEIDSREAEEVGGDHLAWQIIIPKLNYQSQLKMSQQNKNLEEIVKINAESDLKKFQRHIQENKYRKFSNSKNWSFYRVLIWIFEKRAAIASDDYGIERTTIRNMHVSLRDGRRFNLMDFPDIAERILEIQNLTELYLSLIAILAGAEILAKKLERDPAENHKCYRMYGEKHIWYRMNGKKGDLYAKRDVANIPSVGTTHKWYRMHGKRCTPAECSFVSDSWESKYREKGHVFSNGRDSKVS